MKPKTAEKLIKITGELYEKEAQSFSDTRKDVWEKEIIDFVDKIKPGSSILDLGCGNGRLFVLLHSKRGLSRSDNGLTRIENSGLSTSLETNDHSNNNENVGIFYLGIDTSKKLIEFNKEKYGNSDDCSVGVKFKVGNALGLNFKNKFDYVISIAVLHHIPSEELQLKFLKNIYEALKPGGKTLISVWNRLHEKYQKYLTIEYKQKVQHQFSLVPNLFSDLQNSDHIVPWRQSGLFRFIHTFEPKELKSLAQKAGFKNIEILVSKHGIETNIKTALNIYLIATKKKE